jgi:MFS family permease
VGHGLFIGFLGNGGINAPLYVYVSRWFDRRRGSALALISSGAYVAGAVWPPIFERAIAAYGWQQTMWAFGLVEMAGEAMGRVGGGRGTSQGAVWTVPKVNLVTSINPSSINQPVKK